MVTARVHTVAVACLGLTALLVIGFWVGAFESFGGYLEREKAFLAVSLILGLIVAIVLHQRYRVPILVAGIFIPASHCIYVLGAAIGKTYYVSQTSGTDIWQTLLLALSGKL